MMKQRLGGDYNKSTGLYPQSVITDKRLNKVAYVLDACSEDTEFGECFIRCDSCPELMGCIRLWLYMVERSVKHGIRYIQELDVAVFIREFSQIQGRLTGNGHRIAM